MTLLQRIIKQGEGVEALPPVTVATIATHDRKPNTGAGSGIGSTVKGGFDTCDTHGTSKASEQSVIAVTSDASVTSCRDNLSKSQSIDNKGDISKSRTSRNCHGGTTPTPPPTRPIDGYEIAIIKQLIAHIGETDQEAIDGIFVACRRDITARERYLVKAEIIRPANCAECIHFKRIDHPKLGQCANGGASPTRLLWDTDSRTGCFVSAKGKA